MSLASEEFLRYVKSTKWPAPLPGDKLKNLSEEQREIVRGWEEMGLEGEFLTLADIVGNCHDQRQFATTYRTLADSGKQTLLEMADPTMRPSDLPDSVVTLMREVTSSILDCKFAAMAEWYQMRWGETIPGHLWKQAEKPAPVTRPRDITRMDCRWITCPQCGGEMGVPVTWTKKSVACPNCASSVSLSKTNAKEKTSTTEEIEGVYSDGDALVVGIKAGPSQASPQKRTIPTAMEPSTRSAARPQGASSITANNANDPKNGYATAGLTFGIIAMFLYVIWLLPVLAIVFSSIGLARASERKGVGQIKSWIGLVLGIIYTFMSLTGYWWTGRFPWE